MDCSCSPNTRGLCRPDVKRINRKTKAKCWGVKCADQKSSHRPPHGCVTEASIYSSTFCHHLSCSRLRRSWSLSHCLGAKAQLRPGQVANSSGGRIETNKPPDSHLQTLELPISQMSGTVWVCMGGSRAPRETPRGHMQTTTSPTDSQDIVPHNIFSFLLVWSFLFCLS